MSTTTKQVVVDGVVVGTVQLTGDFEKDHEAARKVAMDSGRWRPPTTVQAMYGQAMAFSEATLLLNEMLQAMNSPPALQARAAGVNWRANLTAPFVVNYAFSVELLLKTLGALHGAKLKDRLHNLFNLFGQLPPVSLKVIDETIGERSPGKSRKDLEAVLQSVAKAFIEWRYSYETGSACRVNIPSAVWAAEMLEAACIAAGEHEGLGRPPKKP